jgi:uncharacterized SAM-binding protein YcdF (DUF218 family)
VFLTLSKILDWLLAPLTWGILLLGAAALFRRRTRRAWILAVIGVATLVLFSLPSVANRLQWLVEGGARSTYRPDVVYDAVVVLGGMVDHSASRITGTTELTEEIDRLVRGFELLRERRAHNVLLSGGVLRPLPGDVQEADRLAAKLLDWGIPPGQIVVEPGSRNTRENAIESARVAAAHGWKRLLVVTSAAHAPRALACFRALGLEPDMLPVDFRAGDGRGQGWLPRAWALAKSTNAIRELAGRVVYRVVGYTG